EYRGIWCVARDRCRAVEIVEPQVQRAARLDSDKVRADRFAIGEEHGDADMRGYVTRVENAGGLMRDQRRIGERALRWNIAFRNGPVFLSEHRHVLLPCRAAEVCCCVSIRSST